MKLELYEAMVEDLAEDLAKRGAEKIVAQVAAQAKLKAENPLMSVRECAEHLGLSESKTRDLVNAGLIKKAPGLKEIRVRKSELDKYGTSEVRK